MIHGEYTWLDWVDFVGCKQTEATGKSTLLYIHQRQLKKNPIQKGPESLQVPINVSL